MANDAMGEGLSSSGPATGPLTFTTPQHGYESKREVKGGVERVLSEGHHRRTSRLESIRKGTRNHAIATRRKLMLSSLNEPSLTASTPVPERFMTSTSEAKSLEMQQQQQQKQRSRHGPKTLRDTAKAFVSGPISLDLIKRLSSALESDSFDDNAPAAETSGGSFPSMDVEHCSTTTPSSHLTPTRAKKLITRLCEYLQTNDSKLHLISTHCIANIAASSSNEISYQCLPAIPFILPLCEATAPSLQMVGLWALSNLVAGGSEQKKILFQHGVTRVVHGVLSKPGVTCQVAMTAMWCLSNMLKPSDDIATTEAVDEGDSLEDSVMTSSSSPPSRGKKGHGHDSGAIEQLRSDVVQMLSLCFALGIQHDDIMNQHPNRDSMGSSSGVGAPTRGGWTDVTGFCTDVIWTTTMACSLAPSPASQLMSLLRTEDGLLLKVVEISMHRFVAETSPLTDGFGDDLCLNSFTSGGLAFARFLAQSTAWLGQDALTEMPSLFAKGLPFQILHHILVAVHHFGCSCDISLPPSLVKETLWACSNVSFAVAKYATALSMSTPTTPSPSTPTVTSFQAQLQSYLGWVDKLEASVVPFIKDETLAVRMESLLCLANLALARTQMVCSVGGPPSPRLLTSCILSDEAIQALTTLLFCPTPQAGVLAVNIIRGINACVCDTGSVLPTRTTSRVIDDTRARVRVAEGGTDVPSTEAELTKYVWGDGIAEAVRALTQSCPHAQLCALAETLV